MTRNVRVSLVRVKYKSPAYHRPEHLPARPPAGEVLGNGLTTGK